MTLEPKWISIDLWGINLVIDVLAHINCIFIYLCFVYKGILWWGGYRTYDLATLNRQSISVVKWITYLVLYKIEISHNYIQKIVIFSLIFIDGWDFS